MISYLALAVGALVCLVAIGVASFVLVDGSVRRAFLIAVFRRLAPRFSPTYAIVGDSLATQCDWRRIGRRPLDVVNLARGGATIKEIAGQVLEAGAIGAQCMIIDGGLNDLLLDEAPIQQIEYDFRALLRRIGVDRRAIVTLMPYVADPALAPRIDAANGVIRALAEQRGFAIIDLNSKLSSDGARRAEMTDDGLHFSPLACAIWVEAVREAVVGEARLAGDARALSSDA